jgi:hypothetical protein
MVTLSALAASMQLGKFPEWSPALTMRLGDALAEQLASGYSGLDDQKATTALAEMRTIMVDFGALDADDDVTGLPDLLAVLLPPGGDGG